MPATPSTPDLALDIGGTWCRAAAVTPDGEVIARRRAPTRPARSGEEILETCRDLVVAAAREAGIAVRGLGVGVTGPVDPRSGTMYAPPNAAGGLVGLELGAGLSELLGRVPVVVEKDTNASALAESLHGAGRGVDDFVYATFSTGVGGAVMCDGRLLHGANGVAGEFGHVSVDPLGPLCGCGRVGCLEALASGPALAARALEAGYRRDPAAEPLEGEVDGREIAMAARAGDEVAMGVMASARAAMVRAVVDWANVFNPALVVLGGSVLHGNLEWVPAAEEAVRSQALDPAGRDVRVAASELGDDGVLLGAAGLLRDPRRH